MFNIKYSKLFNLINYLNKKRVLIKEDSPFGREQKDKPKK